MVRRATLHVCNFICARDGSTETSCDPRRGYQMHKEEEIMHGVEYHYKAPVHNKVDAAAVKMAKRLSTMDSASSSKASRPCSRRVRSRLL